MADRPADFLLGTGPTVSSARVLAAQAAPVAYHRDPVFVERFRALCDALGHIFRTSNDIIVMQGEAVLGLEASLVATVRPGIKVINVANGPYGVGMGDWLRSMDARVIDVSTGFREVPGVDAIRTAIATHPDAELLSIVHVETPCGTVSPIADVGPMCRAAGIVSLVDVVASLGGMDVRTDEWQLDICVAAPEKCLGGPTGLSLMSVSQQAWDLVGKNPAAPRFSFLSLLDWKDRWIDKGEFPFTPSIADVTGTLAACEQLLDEGLEASFARHALAARAARSGVVAMGLGLWPIREQDSADTATAIALPSGLTDTAVLAHARTRYGVQLSGGEGAGDLVRIGHMGETARSMHPIVGLAAVGQTLTDLGHPVDVGAGVAAAMRVLAG